MSESTTVNSGLDSSFINELPNDVLRIILNYFQNEESIFLGMVSKRWRGLIKKRGYRPFKLYYHYGINGNLEALKYLKYVRVW
jgi:hypothetical protein